ncbi:MAG: hypothetical protein LBL50_04055, partial [Candidatus Margulisbacteria bacterium]|nr:hypothetical protein [Candidatus Margulisiibacteriota bacterium]
MVDVNGNNYSSAGMRNFITDHAQQPKEVRPPYKVEASVTTSDEFYRSSAESKTTRPTRQGILGDTRNAGLINSFYDFFNRERPNFIIQVQAGDLDIVNNNTGAYKDTSVTPLLTLDVDRNDPDTHKAIVEATISRTAWVEEPRPENGKIFDLDFRRLEQEIVQKIRGTSAQNSPEMHDIPMATLRDIYELTSEDIELFDGDYKKEALRLIQGDMQERIQEAGDEDKGLMSFAEMVMHYPPNDGRFGQAGELPDFGNWKGDFKVGFRMVNNKLEIVKNSMELTTMPGNDQLKLVFSTVDHDADGNEKITKYNIIYDI